MSTLFNIITTYLYLQKSDFMKLLVPKTNIYKIKN